MNYCSSLNDPEVRAVLQQLHKSARTQVPKLMFVGSYLFLNTLFGRKYLLSEWIDKTKNLYQSVSPEQGNFFYFVARSIRAAKIVEFGTSFGISTIYLAAAIKDNGGGIVISSEIDEGKAQKAQSHLREAGLENYVDIRLGDGRQTLADTGGVVDMVLLDGYKELYIPIIQLLTPHLHQGTVVLGDDMNVPIFRKKLGLYSNFMQDTANGFQSTTLPLSHGIEYSIRL